MEGRKGVERELGTRTKAEEWPDGNEVKDSGLSPPKDRERSSAPGSGDWGE